MYNALKEEGCGGTAGIRRQPIRGILVSAEVALALSLLVVSTLLARSFVLLMRADLGFQSDHVLMLESNLSNSAYGTCARRINYYRPLLRKLSDLPGVAVVGGLRYFPLHARLWGSAIQVQEKPMPANSRSIVC